MRRLLGVFTALILVVGLGLPLPAQASSIRCLDAACMSMELTGDLVVDGTEHQLYGTNFGPRRLEGNGYQILVVNDGTLDWNGVAVTNVSRIMFTDGAGPSTLRNMTIEGSGRPELGFYPLHWHLNGDTTRGTLVENVTIRNSQNRAFVPHGSHGISFIDTRAEGIAGPAFWWDPPGTTDCGTFPKFCTTDNSNDILVDGMVVDGVTNAPGDLRGYRLAGYVLGAGSGNVIRNSAAYNVNPSHVKDCSGFTWPEGANQNVGGNVWVFENNHGESRCHGIFVWQNDSNHHVIDGFTGGGIDHGAYGNNYEYRNVDVPYVEIHARGWVMVDSHAGHTVAWKHVGANGKEVRFINVTFDSFTVNNATNGGTVSGVYILDGSNLDCEDIIYQLMVPGTRVIIDGVGC